MRTSPGAVASRASRSNSVGVRCTSVAARPDPPRARVDDQVADDEPGRRAGGQLGGALDAAQQGAHPGDQLAHPEGLGQVVVGADPEPDQDVGLVVTSGEHQHRHRLCAWIRRHTSCPSKPGQHHVEDDEVGGVAACFSTAPGPS